WLCRRSRVTAASPARPEIWFSQSAGSSDYGQANPFMWRYQGFASGSDDGSIVSPASSTSS
ncbi:MAG: hypothetical protein M3036_14030, partial [Bifidobacteriales bacterium]|nr:hypothetical protein [Bifidobacteriales bacterium]